MSFGITAVGTVAQVRAQLEKQHQELAAMPGDRSQYDRAYEMINAELDDWPTTTASASRELGLHVEASGHHDTFQRTLSITLRPVWFPKVDEQS